MSELNLKFRKKPVVIEAFQFQQPTSVDEAPEWLTEAVLKNDFLVVDGVAHITTLEGIMTAQPGDWIIRGVKGEIYPCKPDIFSATYEPAAPVSTPQQSAQRASVDTPEFRKLLIAMGAAVGIPYTYDALIAHINAWGSAGSGATDGWISVNERLPARCEEVFVWPYPSDYCMTAEMWSLEPAPGVKWVHNEYVTGYGNEKVTMHRAPTHWRPIFAAPSPAPQGEQA